MCRRFAGRDHVGCEDSAAVLSGNRLLQPDRVIALAHPIPEALFGNRLLQQRHRRFRLPPFWTGSPNYELYQITEPEPEVFERVVEQQIAGIGEELAQLKTETERLKEKVMELGGEDATVIGSRRVADPLNANDPN